MTATQIEKEMSKKNLTSSEENLIAMQAARDWFAVWEKNNSIASIAAHFESVPTFCVSLFALETSSVRGYAKVTNAATKRIQKIAQRYANEWVCRRLQNEA